MIVHLISTMSVVWRKGPREKRRPKSGRTLVTHGRISGPFWFSTIFCKISVFEHTPPLKKINIFDRTHWSRILGFKIGASQGSNWLKTKKSDGPFWRKSWEDFQKIKGSISKKGLIRFFCFSSSQAQKGPNFKALYMVLMGPVESVKIFRGRGVLHQICPFFWGGGAGTHLYFNFSYDCSPHIYNECGMKERS